MDSPLIHIKTSSHSNHTNSICPEILIKNQSNSSDQSLQPSQVHYLASWL
ncbi:hypothetical protein DFH28DRAFT_1130201 [Melampsora americana]|nr:hypothetical protein DFH28DRAFT_1130201 [Melampsora americana]